MKVLDFGLAKATEPAGGASLDVMNSPTITSPAMMTGVGMKSVRMLCEPWRDMAAKGSAIGYRYRAALSVRSVLPESKDYAMVPFEAGPGPKTESMSIGSIQDRIYPRMMGISAGRLAAC